MIAESVTAILQHLREERHYKEQRKDAALNAIHDALVQTLIYSEKVSKGNADREVEEKLAQLWTKAGLAVRHLDRDLADRCLLKGRYWIEPGNWSRKYILENRIALKQVEVDIKSLLKD